MAMTLQVSLDTKLKRLDGLRGTSSVSEWEERFLTDLVPRALEMASRGQVMRFSERQMEVIDNLFQKHFAA